MLVFKLLNGILKDSMIFQNQLQMLQRHDHSLFRHS